MSKIIVLASLPELDQPAAIAEGLRIARSLEDSVLLLKLAIAEFEEIEDESKQFRTALVLLTAATSQLDCFAEENRISWQRL